MLGEDRMALQLPSSLSLKSHQNNKYVAYIEEEGELQGLFKSSAEDVNPLTIIDVEKAKSGDDLVHLKSSYNGKYLRRLDRTNWWIAAVADEPEEDQLQWSCTLFKPVFVDGDDKTIQLIHVQLGHYVRPWIMYEPFELCLFAAEKNPDKEKQDAFTITALPAPADDHLNIDFGFKDALAKIYGQTTEDLSIGIANNASDTEQKLQVVLDYDKSESSTWKSSSSSSSSNCMGLSNIKSAIPVIINGRIELSGSVFSGPYIWGTAAETKYSNVKTTYKVIVPPKTRVIVKLKATKAFFDVPFKYYRLASTHKKEDGMFTGINLYNFRYETEHRKIYN